MCAAATAFYKLPDSPFDIFQISLFALQIDYE
jgi:hypothetical protein